MTRINILWLSEASMYRYFVTRCQTEMYTNPTLVFFRYFQTIGNYCSCAFCVLCHTSKDSTFYWNAQIDWLIDRPPIRTSSAYFICLQPPGYGFCTDGDLFNMANRMHNGDIQRPPFQTRWQILGRGISNRFYFRGAYSQKASCWEDEFPTMLD